MSNDNAKNPDNASFPQINARDCRTKPMKGRGWLLLALGLGSWIFYSKSSAGSSRRFRQLERCLHLSIVAQHGSQPHIVSASLRYELVERASKRSAAELARTLRSFGIRLDAVGLCVAVKCSVRF